MLKHISCDCKCKFNSWTCNSNQKWNNEICQCECKNYHTCKNGCRWDSSTCIVDTTVIGCDKIMYIMDIVSTKMTNTIATNTTSMMSINCRNKKFRYNIDCYVLSTVLLMNILLLITAIICCHYAKDRSKLKNILPC